MPLIENFTLPPNQLHLWVFSQSSTEQHNKKLENLLVDEENERAEKYLVEYARSAYIVRRATLRLLLSLYSNKSPQSIVFDYEAYGKPTLTTSDIYFNMSHSENMAIIGISKQKMGVDIEKIKPINDLELVARHHFAEVEHDTLFALDPISQISAFYSCWTRKEAIIKLIGTGLAIPLDSFAVSLEDIQRPSVRFLDNLTHPSYHLYSSLIENNFQVAIATYNAFSQVFIKTMYY